MSFVDQEDVFDAMEPVLRGVFEEFARGKPVTPSPWPRIPYPEAMRKYGSDKPDLRNPIVIQNVTEHVRGSDFKFRGLRGQGGGGQRLCPTPAAGSRATFFDKLEEARTQCRGRCGALAWLRSCSTARRRYAQDRPGVAYSPSSCSGGTASDLPDRRPQLGRRATRSSSSPTIRRNSPSSPDWRAPLGQELGLIEEDRYKFCWIVDFPMFEWNEDEKKIDFSHNPVFHAAGRP